MLVSVIIQLHLRNVSKVLYQLVQDIILTKPNPYYPHKKLGS